MGCKLLNRIWIDPARCAGKPCIRGHRIWVSLILDLIASGETYDDILKNYPGLTIADIQACIAYGSEMARERFVEGKTTAFGKETPFFVSRNEVEFSATVPDQFHLYRVFEFRRNPRLFDLRGRVQDRCHLDPFTFLARFFS